MTIGSQQRRQRRLVRLAASPRARALITAGDLLRTFFGIFAAEAHAARCHNVWISAQPASTLPQLSRIMLL